MSQNKKNHLPSDCKGHSGLRRSGAPPGPRKADLRRAALVEVAGKLFVEKGYEATTMDEIAAAANFAKGTLYHYFSNKAELLRVLREVFENDVMERVRVRVESCPVGDWRGRVIAWIEATVEAYFELRELHDVVIYSLGMPFRHTMAKARITRYLTELIRDGGEAGAWQVDDERWTAVVMFYAFRGACDEAMMGAESAEDVSRKLNVLFLRILRVKG